MQSKFKVGQYWNSRDGVRCLVIAVSSMSIVVFERGKDTYLCTQEGSRYSGQLHSFDLVSLLPEYEIGEGWEIARDSIVRLHDEFWCETKKAWMVTSKKEGNDHDSGVVYRRRIETARQFANAAEFEPHCEKWFKSKLGDASFRGRIDQYSDAGVFIGGIEACQSYEHMFNTVTFADGTPFGVSL